MSVRVRFSDILRQHSPREGVLAFDYIERLAEEYAWQRAREIVREESERARVLGLPNRLAGEM